MFILINKETNTVLASCGEILHLHEVLDVDNVLFECIAEAEWFARGTKYQAYDIDFETFKRIIGNQHRINKLWSSVYDLTDNSPIDKTWLGKRVVASINGEKTEVVVVGHDLNDKSSLIVLYDYGWERTISDTFILPEYRCRKYWFIDSDDITTIIIGGE